MQFIGYANDINIMDRMKRAAPEVYKQLKKTAKKTKAMVQNKRRISKILTIKDHDIDIVRSFKYLTAINNINDETEEIKARNLPMNKAYFSLQTIFRLNKSTKIIK